MPDHHPTIASKPPLSPLSFVDQHMRDRLGTLLSIDDLVAGLLAELAHLNVLDNTYILFSSDVKHASPANYACMHWRCMRSTYTPLVPHASRRMYPCRQQWPAT